MRYMLDTNIVSDLIKNPLGKAAVHLAQLAPDQVCTTTIVAGELRYGVQKKASTKLRQRVQQILETIPVLPLDAACADTYGNLRAELENKGLSIGANDLWIAAHALTADKVLVSDNVKEFSRIHHLQLENWLRA